MYLEILGINEMFIIDEMEITTYTTSNGDVYEEAYQLEDGRWIAFDYAINSWVMLGKDGDR